MNEQLESLIFYIKWLRAQGVSKEELVSQQDCVDYFLKLMALAQPNALYRAHNWSGANEPLPLLAIDLAANFNAAIKEAFTEQNVFVPAKENKHYFEQYAEKECKTGEEKESLIADVESFWKRLNSYMTPQNQRAYGLAVGRVQSGKTRNYIGLMFKAIDEGYNTIIILTSKNSRLAVQTHDRVEKSFPKAGFANPHFLTYITKDGGVAWYDKIPCFEPNNVQIGIIMKNESGHLEKLKDWMDNDNVKEAKGNMRFLFIDDESDSATPNTKNGGEPLINSDEDVERLIQRVVLSDHRGAEQIASWMDKWKKQIFEATVAEEDIKSISHHLGEVTGKTSFMDGKILDNVEFKHLTTLDEEVPIDGQNWNLFRLVYDFFNVKATRRRPLNWRALRDFFNYMFGVRQERSRINDSICKLVGQSANEPAVFSYDKMIYVGYTATPFANMLNENPANDPLYPDCIMPLATNSRYFGLQRIFGGEDGACNMDIVCQIPDSEYEGWVQTLQTDPESIKDLREIECSSLKRAVKWAFCTAAARRIARLAQTDKAGNYAPISDRWTTMLFNLSHLSDQDVGVHPVQQKLLKDYIEYQSSPEHREEFVEECMAVWDEETARFKKADFEKSCPGYGKSQDYPARDSIREKLYWFIRNGGKVNVIQMNSAVNGNEQKDYNNPKCEEGDVLWFVCGGNAISRGLTLEGLTVSYYDRIKGSSCVDTITQMGRWFGYRKGYELLPRIWMTPRTIGEMKKICRVEESLHSELQDLWGVEEDNGNGNKRYPPSLREGQNTASIRYFGRRLSGRDANGMQFDGAASKCVFETVHEDKAQTAFERTSQFCTSLGDVFPVQWENPDDRHARHRLFWKNAESADIAQFIENLKEEYLAGPSVYDAEGLLRELEDYPGLWNVVVGNPKGKDLPDVGDGFYEGYCRRSISTPIQREDGSIRLSRKQFTEEALLARVPNEDIEVYEAIPNNRIGIRQIDVIYKRLQNNPNRQWLTNPTLLIDFVNGDAGQLFTQISFYWHGHSQESFFRAIVNPTRPSVIARVVDCLNVQGYASLTYLHHCFAEQLDKNDFKEELDMVCKQPNPLIGRVDDDAADKSILSHNVYYSKAWLANQDCPIYMSPEGDVIGMSLYHRICKERLNCCQYTRDGVIPTNQPYKGIGYVNHELLEQKGLGGIIRFDYINNREMWWAFADNYRNIERYGKQERERAAEQERLAQRRPPWERRLLCAIFNASTDTAEPIQNDMTLEQKREAFVVRLGITDRAVHALTNAGIATIGELIEKSAADLIGYYGFSQDSLETIRTRLAQIGLHLKGE